MEYRRMPQNWGNVGQGGGYRHEQGTFTKKAIFALGKEYYTIYYNIYNKETIRLSIFLAS